MLFFRFSAIYALYIFLMYTEVILNAPVPILVPTANLIAKLDNIKNEVGEDKVGNSLEVKATYLEVIRNIDSLL